MLIQTIRTILTCSLMCSICHHVLGFTTPTHQHRNRPSYPSLAAAKKNPKKKTSNTARTPKGFGAPPPPPLTYEETIARFRTRMPDDADNQPCPCGGKSDTEKLYGQCCGPLHRGERLALTTTDVLQSRYTAFAWRLIPYVIESTHETCRDFLENKVDWANSLNKYGMFDSFDFVKLEPGPEEKSAEDENEGYIEFSVTLRARDQTYLENHTNAIISGQETRMTERSTFIRDPSSGVWSYASGDVRSSVAGLEDLQLNKS